MGYGSLTREDLELIIRDNAGWMFDDSLVQVQKYVQACTAWLQLPIQEMDHAGERVRIDPSILRDDRDKALRWYANRRRLSTRGKVIYADMTDFREQGGGHNDATRC